MINYARGTRGLAPFAYNDQLAAAAARHNQWMADTGTFSHTGEGGSQPADRVAAAGYDWIAVGEALYMGEGRFDSPAGAYDAWWYSVVHHENIISPKYREVGASIIRTAGGMAYYTMMFGAQANVLPILINGGDATTAIDQAPPGTLRL